MKKAILKMPMNNNQQVRVTDRTSPPITGGLVGILESIQRECGYEEATNSQTKEENK